MSQRLPNITKWLWCLLMVSGPIGSVTIKSPPKVPGVIEAQAKFFQDFFSVQLSPYNTEFGHVCEDPNTWEQRYEKKDFKNHRHMGKVRWGDKQGGYGEHYWDLNHAGHADNHGNDDYGSDSDDYRSHDDGSYKSNDDEGAYRGSDDGSYRGNDDGSYKVHDDDPYDEPSEQVSAYNDGYDAQKAAQSPFEETNRAKRAHQRYRPEKKAQQNVEEVKTLRKAKEEEKKNTESHVSEQQPRKTKTKRHKPREQNYEEEPPNYTVEPQPQSYSAPVETTQPPPRLQKEQTRYVPYEGGAGIRQYHPPEVAAASASRLFLEPSTGHVVDRSTGQAYILQPIVAQY